MVMANQPDIVVMDKEQRKAVVVDVATPSDGNIRKKEHEEVDKYPGLREELEKTCKVKVTVVPMVIGALWAVTPNLEEWLQQISGYLYWVLQRSYFLASWPLVEDPRLKEDKHHPWRVKDKAARLSTMKKRTKKVLEEEDTLCCCEYVNGRGERSHVAACCCDCEDLDDVCDRFLKREPQKPDSFSKVAEVLMDRIRVPWLWGGARKVDLSIVPPLILLPILLHIAALHFLLGVLVLTALPGLVLWYYYVSHRKKGRTLFFLSLALFSLAYMYYLFVTVVVPRGDVGMVQLAIITLGVIFTLAALIRTKKGPGVVLPNREACHSTVTYYTPLPEEDPAFNGRKHEVKLMERTGVSEPTEGEVKEGHHKNWCPVCRVLRPPRAGHCRICGVCVLRLDHHCVWINSCVGQANHLSFLLSLILFLLTSLYGICLVLQSVCLKQHFVTALLYCPGAYSEFNSALCFTCAWYSSIVTGGLFHLLMVQVINISYNVTEREARMALREKTAQRAFWGLIVDTQVYSRGFWLNWSEFLSMGDKVNLASLTPADVV